MFSLDPRELLDYPRYRSVSDCRSWFSSDRSPLFLRLLEAHGQTPKAISEVDPPITSRICIRLYEPLSTHMSTLRNAKECLFTGQVFNFDLDGVASSVTIQTKRR